MVYKALETGTSFEPAVGIDVSKTRLDASAGGAEVRSFANDAEGGTAIVEWLEAQAADLAVCEPTGGYEEPLVRGLLRAGIAVRLAHPNKVRAFARARGHLDKTGRLDAQALSHYGRVFLSAQNPQTAPDGEEQDKERVQALLRRRRQLVGQRVQERNR